MFGLTAAKREVLTKLAERDWTPTDLAGELDKSRQAVYNHLEDLAERGVLSKTKVPAKTRPKTSYSIGDGFLQYVAVVPGEFQEGTLALTGSKEALLRIWLLPQPEIHPFLETVWIEMRDVSGLEAATVYGSVARGEASPESDIDLLLVAADDETATELMRTFGSRRVTIDGQSRLVMAETYTTDELRTSVAHGSDFLANALGEGHIIYDPDGTLRDSEPMPK